MLNLSEHRGIKTCIFRVKTDEVDTQMSQGLGCGASDNVRSFDWKNLEEK
jgi:hypothetical protein